MKARRNDMTSIAVTPKQVKKFVGMTGFYPPDAADFLLAVSIMNRLREAETHKDFLAIKSEMTRRGLGYLTVSDAVSAKANRGFRYLVSWGAE